ncbi:esterase/lipase family protein [Rhodococcus sp. 06-235-1A]|uniref:esterase/lipase family protein n=1 Tax=Rhodococcus sp. 06-235-1A TaxID=2022508 RepID=UPI0015C680C2|nr:alpha/beta hydrolase [Rhodococcus sp. 06-235-1A]
MGEMECRPLILIRGFGGVDVADEQRSAYQGYNDGTVYPTKRGDNYIYEGFLLRALKSKRYRYTDATNVVGYYAQDVDAPADTGGHPPSDVRGTVVIDPRTAARVLNEATSGTIWVYRFYDLSPRTLARYADGLARLISLIQRSSEQHNQKFDGVDVIAHSMGGLVLREALIAMGKDTSQDLVHRIVTLGTPHRGIAFQRVPRWLLDLLPGARDASDELASFSPSSTRFLKVLDAFPARRILTVVGTNYRTYGASGASMANRLSTLFDGGSLSTNRSDGLVKQSAAQLPGAPRTFVHKCHGGVDSLVTCRESYEIAMRFLHGSHHIQLWLDEANIERGQDCFGKSEFYFGVTIKPRYVDFELFHQSPEAENCYGPFDRPDLLGGPPDLKSELEKSLGDAGDHTTGWAGPKRLVWEGWVDQDDKPDPDALGLVFRLDVYVGERDSYGVGFSDNVIFRKQYYVQVFPRADGPAVFVHTGERFLGSNDPQSEAELELLADNTANGVQQLARSDAGDWTFDVGRTGSGFSGKFRIAIEEDL